MNAQISLLGFLNRAPNYGYELKKLYDNFFGQEKPILAGQVYSSLSRLERDAKISELPASAKEQADSAGPDRIKYQITPLGSDCFEQWLRTPEEASPYLQTNLYYKVVLALLNNVNADHFLDIQRHAHIERMRELTRERQASRDITHILLIDNAIFHIEADLRWIDLTSSRIHQLKEAVCQSL